MKRRSSYLRPTEAWWMHPGILFTVLLCFGTIATILGLRIAGILP